MMKLNRDSDMVRIRVDIPQKTYEHIMEMVKLNDVTNSPDVVVAGCIDSIYDMTVSHNWKYKEEK